MARFWVWVVPLVGPHGSPFRNNRFNPYVLVAKLLGNSLMHVRDAGSNPLPASLFAGHKMEVTYDLI